MRIVGIDPSLTRTGVAVVTADGVELTSIPTPTAAGLVETQKRIARIVAGVDAAAFGPGLGFDPDLVVIETPYVPHGAKAAGKVIERCWLFGALVDAFSRSEVPVVEVAAANRAKYATGSGSAGKAEVKRVMRKRFPGLVIGNDDVADALALAAMGARWAGRPIDGPASERQLEAVRVPQWPGETKEKDA